MSFQAMTWAVEQKCGSAAAKLVLLMLANHTNSHTGQCNPRHKTLADECEMHIDTLKTHIKNLAERGLVTIIPKFAEGVQLPNQYILNFTGGGVENSVGVGGKIHGGGGGKNTPPINQEVKSGNKPRDEAEASPPATPAGDGAASPEFTQFWEAWPKSTRKGAKGKCYQAWVRAKADEQIGTVLAHVEALKTSKAWTEDAGRFIPAPLVYLNQRMWEGADIEVGTDGAGAASLGAYV